MVKKRKARSKKGKSKKPRKTSAVRKARARKTRKAPKRRPVRPGKRSGSSSGSSLWMGHETVAASAANDRPNLDEVTGAGRHPGGVEPVKERIHRAPGGLISDCSDAPPEGAVPQEAAPGLDEVPEGSHNEQPDAEMVADSEASVQDIGSGDPVI